MNKRCEETIIRRPDGSIDTEFYLKDVAKLRNAALRQAVADLARRLPAVGGAPQPLLRWLGLRMHIVR